MRRGNRSRTVRGASAFFLLFFNSKYVRSGNVGRIDFMQMPTNSAITGYVLVFNNAAARQRWKRDMNVLFEMKKRSSSSNRYLREVAETTLPWRTREEGREGRKGRKTSPRFDDEQLNKKRTGKREKRSLAAGDL